MVLPRGSEAIETREALQDSDRDASFSGFASPFVGFGLWSVGRFVVGFLVRWVADCGGLRLFMACGFLNTGHR